ncbi:hypothetical protein ABFV57_07160 [Pseudomonas neuropathica]
MSGSRFTGGGARFRSDRPSYEQMLDYSDTQLEMFVEQNEAIGCFFGD